jgi:outer membrane protein OmpA-like peptidoglycan-associated protein
MNTNTMAHHGWTAFRRWFYIVAAVLGALTLLSFLLRGSCAVPATTATTATAATAATAATTAATAASRASVLPPAVPATPLPAPAPTPSAAAVAKAPAASTPAAPMAAATEPARPVAAPEPARQAAAPAKGSAAAAGAPEAKVYFTVNSARMPRDAGNPLGEVVAYLKSNPGAKAVVTGFHDPRGSVAQNDRLAQNRAKAVRAALQGVGIERDRIVLERPVETTGSGDNASARRVEVKVR